MARKQSFADLHPSKSSEGKASVPLLGRPGPATEKSSGLPRALAALRGEVIDCSACPRLAAYCREVAREKRRAYAAWDYWGRPVPSFGDPRARLLILGLAPAAHGANRTGRMFTGDRSGDFLYSALHRAGFASQPTSLHRDDGLELRDAWITAAVRCAPPGNKPLPEEQARCRRFLERELELLPNVRAVLALGKIAFDTYLAHLKDAGAIPSRSGFVFSHGASYRMPAPLPALFSSYHPSQQNTFTGKLTPPMLDALFAGIRRFLDKQ